MKQIDDGRLRPDAVLYARVSSKDQAIEGFSIPAQLDLLRSYAIKKGFTIAQEFIDVETAEAAKTAGRASFGDMIAFLNKSADCRTILVEKPDRLYRNLRDAVAIEDLGVEVHFVKENQVLSPASRSSDKFMHGIQVLMARNYVLNLGEETRKGMLEKARQGIWPSYAPLGYRNVAGPDGKRTIVPDPELAAGIRNMYERYATGKFTLKELARLAQADGVVFRKSGKPLTKSTIDKILRNRIYTGDFDFDGATYKGAFEPIVSRELWEDVQAVLAGRGARKARTKTFAFSLLQFSPEVLAWAADAMRNGRADERKFHADAIARLRRERQRLQDRLDRMYDDKLDGRIDNDFFDRKAAEFRAGQRRVETDIEAHEAAMETYVDEGARLGELARRAAELFEAQSAAEKRKLLDFVVSECRWKAGELQAVYCEPFGAMANGVRVGLVS